MNNKIRTVVAFIDNGKKVRTKVLFYTIPNMAVGQIMCFDHPNMAACLSGKITDIGHAIYLDGDARPVTYVDVEVDH